MSRFTKGIFAAIAVPLTFGAVAWGRDVAGLTREPAAASETAAVINRAAKADRVAGVAREPAARTRTISLRFDALADTSVLVRLPMVQEAREGARAPAVGKSDGRKMTVACEPVVSVLTEVAKLLQPGRCVT